MIMWLKKRWIRKMLIFTLIIIVLIVFSIWQNNDIVVSKTNYQNKKVPNAFDGYTIVQISDLHNKTFGKNQNKLINEIQAISPDIIVITGDLIDRRKFHLEKAMLFINRAKNIAPIYYVPGNHEAWSNQYPTIRKDLIEANVNVLDSGKMTINRNDSAIDIIGVSDPAFLTANYSEATNTSQIEECLSLCSDENSFQILLSHRPELLSLYARYKMDLVFTGHAHGGQIRLPFMDGLIAPNQGFFPQYTSGS